MGNKIVNWELHKKKLSAGEDVQFRPKGSSMQPKINSGNLITVSPISKNPPKEGDIVFCKVHKNHYVHLVNRIIPRSGRGFVYEIANNKGKVNGIIGLGSIFGKVTKVEN